MFHDERVSSNLALAVALGIAAGLLVGCGAANGVDVRSESGDEPHPRRAPSTAAAGELRAEVRALRLLRAWDRRRAAAYAAGDAIELRRLYAPASRAGARDVATLRAYTSRGLVVEGITVQVLRARLRARSPTLLRLDVVDRVTGATAVTAAPGGGGSEAVALPAVRPTRRVITMVRAGPRWEVRSVRRR